MCIETKAGLPFESFSISELFKKSYFYLANDLVQRLLAAARKFAIASVENYYDNMFDVSRNKLTFETVQANYISNLLKTYKTSKASLQIMKR